MYKKQTIYASIMAVITALVLAFVGFSPTKTTAQVNGAGALPNCFQVIPGQWGYEQPGACTTPLPTVSAPPPQGATWSKAYLASQGYSVANYGANAGLNNYIYLLTDPLSTFSPSPLRYQLLGGDSNTNSVLTENSAGIYFLMLWENLPPNIVNNVPPYYQSSVSPTTTNFSVQILGTNNQVVASHFLDSGSVINYYVNPTTCSNATSKHQSYSFANWAYWVQSYSRC
jgi:hypothetical protein